MIRLANPTVCQSLANAYPDYHNVMTDKFAIIGPRDNKLCDSTILLQEHHCGRHCCRRRYGSSNFLTATEEESEVLRRVLEVRVRAGQAMDR